MSNQKEIVQSKKPKIVKCIVWDLDNTLWEGVLLEDEKVTLRPEVVAVIKEMDRRGILHSIASKNNHDTAMQKLEELELADYFLYPAINWNPKSQSLQQIAQALNINIDTFAFVDDNPFEREEVAHELPEVICIDAADVEEILTRPAFQPPFITAESALRRQMYQSQLQRQHAEEQFTGNNEAFLAKLDMVFEMREAEEDDLQRAEELTVRTNQLNTTGYTYSYAELDQFRQNDDTLLLVATLTDKYGPYGTIGIALVSKEEDRWLLKLLLMSCRVMSRGVGSIMLNYIMQEAKKAGVRLQAEFVDNGRNRMMYITYKFAGFEIVEKNDKHELLENNLTAIQEMPGYVKIIYPN